MSTATAVRTHRDTEQHEGLYGSYEGLPPALQLGEEPVVGEGEQGRSRKERDVAVREDDSTIIRNSFNELADELEEAAAGLSSTRRALRYPAFIEILALGDTVVPEVLERLRISENRPLWLRVLGTLTPFPPGAGESTIDDAADAWIRWGRLTS
jgi:hypothetical protein